MMDFISKSITGRARMSRVIQVKPYSPYSAETEEDEEEEREKENTESISKTPTVPSPQLIDIDGKDAGKSMLKPVRSRSLERMPVSQPTVGKMTTNTHFDKARTHSLGTPDLAPVFTTTKNNVFTTTSMAFNNSNLFDRNNKDISMNNNNDLNDSLSFDLD